VTTLRIALAQVNSTVGDLAGNAATVLDWAGRAAGAGADLVVFPEMMLTGYPVEDLALRASFVAASLGTLEETARQLAADGLGGLAVVTGYLGRRAGGRPRAGEPAGAPQNAAAVLFGGAVAVTTAKHHLPNYGVFDEYRYFVPGDRLPVFRMPAGSGQAVDVAVAICEDLWQDGGPVAVTRQAGAGLLVVPNASPYERGKHEARRQLCARRAREAGAALAYVNMIGGQDELVFDGDSIIVDARGELIARGPQFAETLLVADLDLPAAGGGEPGPDTPAEAGDGTAMTVHRVTLPAADRPSAPASEPGTAPADLVRRALTRRGLTPHEPVPGEGTPLDLAGPAPDGAAPGPDEPAPQPGEPAASLAATTPPGAVWLPPAPAGREQPGAPPVWPRLAPLAEVYAALVTGVRDYVRKNGFRSVILGLSGGIDSALTATIAADALGPQRVHVVLMPSRYSSGHSVSDAEDLAKRQGLQARTVPIAAMVDAFEAELDLAGLAAENLQSRIRGVILMGLSNAAGHLVLTTGNKSEIATGYSTLYGDSAGGFGPIKDVLKTLVWDLARWRNEQARRRGETPPIPENSITKPPSAELAPGQLDTDSLPDYAVLDALLDDYVERDLGAADLIAAGHDPDLVDRVIQLVDRAEYKRRQYPPGPKITPRNFGRDRRLPITNRWREPHPGARPR
jgi:NAD+ synthase (glutamine-hydrolysing)